jgi:glycosyltransferase involved in cell wall biosynthesis
VKPLVSVVIEGYNEEYNGLAPFPDTVAALLSQDFPLDGVELILLGSPPQVEHWKALNPGGDSFYQVRMIPVEPENSHYWRLKNLGGDLAEGEIVAHVDSDALPGPQWLSSLVAGIQSGADVSVGPSLYRSEHYGPNSPWMLAAALPSWSLMLARTPGGKGPQAACIMAHNVALRRDVFQRHKFQTPERSYSSALMYFELVRSGARIAFQVEQKVAHGMTFRWWLGRRHFRTGWETYVARSTEQDWPRIRVLEKFKILEPVLLRMGMVFSDARHWFRYSRVVGVSRTRAILLFPLAVLASFVARVAEMVGMYAAMFAPKSTEHRARF